MKKKISILILVALIAAVGMAFVGCDNVHSLIEPVIGNWELSTVAGVPAVVTNHMTFSGDYSWSKTNLFTADTTGTWSKSDSEYTCDVDDSADDYIYTLSADKSSLTSTESGVAVVYTKM